MRARSGRQALQWAVESRRRIAVSALTLAGTGVDRFHGPVESRRRTGENSLAGGTSTQCLNEAVESRRWIMAYARSPEVQAQPLQWSGRLAPTDHHIGDLDLAGNAHFNRAINARRRTVGSSARPSS